MAESVEHLFLKDVATEILSDFSSTKLYGFTETERKKYDMSCLLERDWSRPLVGQVLWKHSDGIEKDIRTLITDKEAEIQLYVASDKVKHHALFEEVISDYRKSLYADQLWKLKTIWVPSDFDADNEEHRNIAKDIIKDQLVNDLLFNVVFGNLTKMDFIHFCYSTGTPGLNIAILHHIATKGFTNIKGLSKALDVSAGPIRERLALMQGIGVLETPQGGINYQDTQKGRVLLELMSVVYSDTLSVSKNDELVYILNKLGADVVDLELSTLIQEVFPKNPYEMLYMQMIFAIKTWGISLLEIDYSTKITLTPPEVA